MTFDISKMAGAVAAVAPDTNKATSAGGGDYVPPVEGATRLRFIGYVELGKHNDTYQGKPKVEEKVQLVFELSGPRHKAKELDDGTKIPHRMTIKISKSLSEKGWYYKLFKAMNIDGKATHFSQLLGRAYAGTVVHNSFKDEKTGVDKVYATLKGPGGYTVRPPTYDDPETGETRPLPVDEPISAMRLFVWDAPQEYIGDMWKMIHIEGTSGEGENQRSNNIWQEMIRKANNFKGSPVDMYLQGAPEDMTPGAAVEKADKAEGTPPWEGEDAPADNDDPLNGVV